jgi:signal transduction histidine kinase
MRKVNEMSTHGYGCDVATASIDAHDQVVAMIGHDLRNPLSALLLGVRHLLLQDHRDAELLNRMARSGERMARMLDRLLDYVRLRVEDEIPLHRRECALDDICRHVVEELQLVHAGARISLDAPVTIVGSFDEERLAEVFSNLVGNACEHGGGSVAVKLRRGIGVAVVSVSNDGPAIPAELLPHVFEPFRGRRAARRSSGLGLFLSRELVRGHGGTVDVESSAELGTQFTVTLPLG